MKTYRWEAWANLEDTLGDNDALESSWGDLGEIVWVTWKVVVTASKKTRLSLMKWFGGRIVEDRYGSLKEILRACTITNLEKLKLWVGSLEDSCPQEE